MERGKTSSTGRGGKSKAPQHPQDIFALGSKSTVVVSRDSEKRNIHKPTTSGVERKRETSGFGTQPPSKRARIGSPAEAVGGTSLEVDPVDLVPNVLQALDTHNSDKLLGLLTGSIRLLKSQRSKPDPILCMSMLYLVKIRPNMFAHETVTQTLCTLLKREHGAAFKSKGNPLVYILACNMLYAGHKDSNNWPDIFIKVYIEDALNERWWVDCSWCKCLVENIVTAFNTKKPPAHLLPSDNTMGTMSPSGSGSPSMGTSEDDVDNNDLEYSVFPRYSASYETVEAMVLEAIKDQIQRRAAPDAIGKGFLKLLSATCGLPEIRMIAASRLEAWLHSGKLWRNAQELLCSVCVNVGASSRDHDALAQLARMRLKTKPLQNTYHAALREMVSDNPTLLRSVVTHTIYNELSNVRAPNNMAVLGTLLLAQPTLLPAAMAQTYQELLFRTDDYLRPLRLLTRELMRAARPDASKLLPLASALVSRPAAPPPPAVRERAFLSTVDLVCVVALCAAASRADVRGALPALQAQLLGWLQDAAPAYRPGKPAYTLALHKIMFLESGESYSKLDNWPGETERAALLRACSDTPLTTAVLTLLLQHQEPLITPTEMFDLIEQLVRRACALPPEDNPIQVDKLKIVEYLFQLCMFTPPENITFPPGYTPPTLIITSMAWRAWIILTMIAAHNPDSFAAKAASMYPTLRSLIETCITNKPSIEWNAATETEIIEAEKAAILQYETHLAAATNKMAPPITEHTSRLLSQVSVYGIELAARRPPPAVLEALQQASAQLRLGRLLCRQPALLLALVERHGTRRAMPWLQHILQHEPQQLSVLPVQCVCEFVCAGGAGGAGGEGAGGARAGELVAHVRRVLLGAAAGARAVLHYYCCRLAHAHTDQRANARKGLKLVLATPIEEVADYDFNVDVNPDEFLDLMWELPHWEEIRDEIMALIRSAVLVECIPKHVASYIVAIARYVRETPDADHTHIVLELSQALMERSTVMNYVLPSAERTSPAQDAALHAITYVLYSYSYRLRENNITEAAPLPADSPWAGVARVLLQWRTAACVMHLLAAHAQLKLLHCPPAALDTNQEMYKYLESIWVGSDAPAAYTLDGMEETELIPDWLRLHMVRSARPALLAAGLRALPAHKLALFIQTFGMPVPSMTALLKALDACPAGAISRLCVERGYMAQLLRVQRARGATGGQAFAAALPLQPTPPTPPEVHLFEDDVPMASSDRRPPSTYRPDPNMQLLAKVSAELSGAGPGTHTAALLSLLGNHSRAMPAALLAVLLRALQPLQPPPSELAKNLLERYKHLGSPVTDILRKLIGDEVKNGDIKLPPKDASSDEFVAVFERATARSLEALGQRVIRTRPERAIAVFTRLLRASAAGAYDTQVKLEDGSSEAHIFSSRGRGCGLLLDWLSELQPEIVGEDPHSQLMLMFRAYPAVWRPLLVTALAHRASWRCLQACLRTLLEHTSEWEPDAVLQFMETLINSERIHQNKSAPCPLKISRKQLRELVRWVTAAAEGADAARAQRLQRRALVLLRVRDADNALLALQVPKSEKLLSESLPRPAPRGTGPAPAPALLSGSATDVPSHTLLTALAARHKNWRLEAALRSLWTYAAGAGQRALPLAAALLRAAPAPPRAPPPLLHALETLPDHELFPRHCEDSGRIMEALILSAGAAAASGSARDQAGLHRAAALLRRCAAAPAPAPAARALAKHHALLQSIPALSGAAAGAPAGTASSSAPPHALQALQSRDRVKPATIQEIESWGARRGGQWGGAAAARRLLAAACPLLADSALAAPVAALLARLLPAAADRSPCMRVILECLDSNQPEIAQNILEKLPDLLICMQEHAALILSKVFEYGIKSRYPVETCISKCITNINMQRGC